MKTYINEGSDFFRYCIGRAVFAIMEAKSFDEISVFEICKTANVGRTTYYRYYGAKTGKRDALLFFLADDFEKKLGGCVATPDKDRIFLDYLYESKDKLRLLQRDGLIEIIDSLIFQLYGPSAGVDKSEFYTKFTGAGLWVGLVRSILANDFHDDADTVRQSIALGLMRLQARGSGM